MSYRITIGESHPDAYQEPKVLEEFNKKLRAKGYSEQQAEQLTSTLAESAENKYKKREVARLKSLMNRRSGYGTEGTNQILFSDFYKSWLLVFFQGERVIVF